MNTKKQEKLAFFGGKPTVPTPPPHFEWGFPTKKQRDFLWLYIKRREPMSIYGDEGIYRKLESEIEKRYKVKYCILTNTGTSALNSAYFGIGLKPGDEVIVPTYTFLATVTPLFRLGATIIFADSDPETGNISPEDIKRKITPKTKAIAVTHMWGVPAKMDKIVSICRRYKLRLIEDCAHAHFTPYNGKLCGTFGDAACFSIGAKKTWTSGEGGFLITNDPEIFIRATLLGHFEVRAKQAIERVKKDGYTKIAQKYEHFTSGYGENYRMHPYSAAMAYAFLTKEWKLIVKKRAESLKYFADGLKRIKGIEPPKVDKNYFLGSMYGFKAKLLPKEINYCGPIEKLIDALRAENIHVKLPDSLPLHENQLFIENNYYYLNGKKIPVKIEGKFEGAKKYLEGRISLPTFSGGLKKDKKIIDLYLRGIEKVLSQAYLIN